MNVPVMRRRLKNGIAVFLQVGQKLLCQCLVESRAMFLILELFGLMSSFRRLFGFGLPVVELYHCYCFCIVFVINESVGATVVSLVA